MKWKLFCAALALLLLTACKGPTMCVLPTPPPTPTPAPPVETPPAASLTCRIVDGAEEGALLLAAEEDGGVYSLGTQGLELTLDGAPAQPGDLRDGMLVEVFYDGAAQETYPMGFSGATALRASTDGLDDLCGLYLQVLEDLWGTDDGLNGGIEKIGMDLSGLTGLTGSEKSALAWRFAGLREKELVTGTWQELVDAGYIDGENLIWEDGLFFSLKGGAEGFDAEKWRGGLGAYFFEACTAAQEGGVWSYTVGSHAIA